MKGLLLLLFAGILVKISIAQHNEFKIHPNGLIYSDTTMRQLGFIVDSLNLKFKRCELQRNYFGLYQATAHFVELSKGNINRARTDMENNISFEDFVRKYPSTDIEKDLLVLKFAYHDKYEKKHIVHFKSILDENDILIRDKPEIYSLPQKGKWVFEYEGKDEYSDEFITAFFFTSEFERTILSEEYARMIQYSDCLVDTTAQIFTKGAYSDHIRFDNKSHPSIERFLEYVNTGTRKPKYDPANSRYSEEYDRWDSLRSSIVDNVLSVEPVFRKLLEQAAIEAQEKGGSNDELEEYIRKYYSKDVALALKRNRIVMGSCSMDDSPRTHAMNIAVLSAETVNWEVFLRAHLDIMNDRFTRASDGSYAWAARKTYIKELEELNINVPDLILGIIFRVENESQNHYYGSIGRVGRALAETKQQDLIESKILQTIRDEKLDNYNRVVMYWLFSNYNNYQQDETRKNENWEKLKSAIKTLPVYLSKRIKLEK